MAYNNYGAPPGGFGAQAPPYGPPGGNGPPFGAAPGFGMPPGFDAQQSHPAMPGQFQGPPNVPGINFNAPVIRLGVDQGAQNGYGGGREDRRGARGSNTEPLGNRNRLGLGADDHRRGGGGDRNLDRERQAVRESMMAMQPPTREEVARTIFVGGLGEGTPDDEAIEGVLRCAGKLRRWTRARDADDKKCKFGFAEYEDVDSLEAANEIFTDVEVPLLKDGKVWMDESQEPKKGKLLVVVDDQSKKYIEEWKGKGKEPEDARQFRLDGCREDLRQTLVALSNIGAFTINGDMNGTNGNGDVHMTDATTNGDAKPAEVVSIPLAIEDELSDIPAEMRATVAQEIKAFRDRSVRRDLERLKHEEEMEMAERRRSARPSRLASPPPSSAPSGPASASNGIPVGPRGAQPQIQGAPAGPRGMLRGAQLPSDYANGVAFVGANGGRPNGAPDQDEDSDSSDTELERRRQAAQDEVRERSYKDALRRTENRERARSAAIVREADREARERANHEKAVAADAKRLREWDDEVEATGGKEEYYADHSNWLRRRAAYLDREQREDNRDRAAEDRERDEKLRKSDRARNMADDFLNTTGGEMARKAEAQQPAFGGLKISLGSAAARTKAATAAPAQRRALADVEGLLDDEEDAAASGMKRPELKPLSGAEFTAAASQDLTDGERAEARQALAAEIPTSSQDLFAYPMKWQYLTVSVLSQQIRPFIEKKVVEFLGVQEEMVVDLVIGGLEQRRPADDVIADLAEVLDDEAVVLMKKVWRMCVFLSEGEARGLN